MKIAAIDGPCKGDFYSIEDEAEFSYKVGDRLMMIGKLEFKINPFHEDVHDIMFSHTPINPITRPTFMYQFYKNDEGQLYLKQVVK